MISVRLIPRTVKNNTRPRIVRALLTILFLIFAIGAPQEASASVDETDTAKLKERLMQSRAVESIIWSLPLMSYKAMRDGFKVDGGVGFNEVGYNSQIQNWKLQITTPNNTTPYVLFFWDTKDGPVVIEIPPSGDGVSLFGPLMDSWQRPLEDVGAKGKDKGRGGKYLVMSPTYRGPLPMNGYYPLRQKTYQGYSLLRPIIADASQENLAKAVALVKKIKIYPLAQADAPPATRHIDVFDKNLNALPDYDGSYFKDLHEIIQEEYIEEKDIAMMGILNAIGIRKGMPFNPDAKTKAILDRAAKDTLQYLIELYHNKILSPYYEGRQWTSIGPPGIRETEYTWVFPTYIALEERGTYFQAIFSSLKTLGAATFYMITSKDADGEWLEGENTFVPLESVMVNNLDLLFPDMEVESCELFRVTRNADLALEEEEADDLLEAIAVCCPMDQVARRVRALEQDETRVRLRFEVHDTGIGIAADQRRMLGGERVQQGTWPGNDFAHLRPVEIALGLDLQMTGGQTYR